MAMISAPRASEIEELRKGRAGHADRAAACLSLVTLDEPTPAAKAVIEAARGCVKQSM